MHPDRRKQGRAKKKVHCARITKSYRMSCGTVSVVWRVQKTLKNIFATKNGSMLASWGHMTRPGWYDVNKLKMSQAGRTLVFAFMGCLC